MSEIWSVLVFVCKTVLFCFFFFSSGRRHTSCAFVTEFIRVLFRSTPQERLLAGIATGETGVFVSEIGFRTAGAALMRVGVDFSGTRRRLFLVVLGPHQLVKKL